MLIISQNLANYGMDIPEDAIYRINLAWVSSINDLKNLLTIHKQHPIFLDIPTKRMKPPNNSYSLNDLIPILESFSNVKYLAISNVESSQDLSNYLKLIPHNIIIVPKIENKLAISNIKEITDCLFYDKKIVMLDHDDLFSSLSKNNESVLMFKNCINELIDFCNQNNITLLRTRGVIFSDDEKRLS